MEHSKLVTIVLNEPDLRIVKLELEAIQKQRNVPPEFVTLRAILTEFGFIYPKSIANWPLSEQPALTLPMGLVTGEVRRDFPKVRLEVAVSKHDQRRLISQFPPFRKKIIQQYHSLLAADAPPVGQSTVH